MFNDDIFEVKKVEYKEMSKSKLITYISSAFLVCIIMLNVAENLPIKDGGIIDALKTNKPEESNMINIIWYENGKYIIKSEPIENYDIPPVMLETDKYYVIVLDEQYQTLNDDSNAIFHVIKYSDGSSVYEEASLDNLLNTNKPKIYELRNNTYYYVTNEIN